MELNKIYNGNAYELIKQIPDKSIDLIYTDIPYLIEHHGTSLNEIGKRIDNRQLEMGDKNTLTILQKKANELKIKMDNAKDKLEYEKWHAQRGNILNRLNLLGADIVSGIDYSIFDEFVRVLKNIYIYIWCSKEQIHDIMTYFIDKYKCTFNLLVWCKTNSVPATNNSWLPNIEYCLVFKGKGAPRYNDGYNLKSKWHVSSCNKNDKNDYNHPTIKPYELVERHILHSTKEGDVVLDPFVGSGTTCLAAKRNNRQYIGFELCEKYYNIAVDRLNGINQKGEYNLFDMEV